MSYLDEVYHQRNKVITIIYWVYALFMIASVFVMPDYYQLTDWIVYIPTLIATLFTVLTAKRWLVQEMKYLVVVALAILMFTFFSEDIKLVGIGILMALLLIYPSFFPSLIFAGYLLVAVNVMLALGVPYEGLTDKPRVFLEANVSLGMLSLVLLSVSYLTSRMLRRITQQMNQIQTSREISEQLLESIRGTVHSLDQFGQNTKRMLLQAGNVTGEVTASFREISAGIEEQTASISEISDLLEAVNREVAEVAERSQKLRQLATESASETVTGSRQMEELATQVEQVSSIMDEIRQSMQRMAEDNEELFEIIRTIATISHQTNILSLNAGIEASRAGEHGKGFAVVAKQIRDLAEHSQKAANHIRSRLELFQRSFAKLAEQVESGKRAIDSSMAAVAVTEQTFQNISNHSHLAADQSLQAENGTMGVKRSSEEIVQRIHAITAVTEQSHAATQQIGASMEQQADLVNQAIESFGQLEQVIGKLNRLSMTHGQCEQVLGRLREETELRQPGDEVLGEGQGKADTLAASDHPQADEAAVAHSEDSARNADGVSSEEAALLVGAYPEHVQKQTG